MHIALSRFGGIEMLARFLFGRWQLEAGTLQFENRITWRFQRWHRRGKHHIYIVQMLVGGSFVVWKFSAKIGMQTVFFVFRFDSCRRIAMVLVCVPDFEYALQWRFRFFTLRCAAADVHDINFLRQSCAARSNVIHATNHDVFSLRSAVNGKWKMKCWIFEHLFARRRRRWLMACIEIECMKNGKNGKANSDLDEDEEWGYSLYVTRTLECILYEFVWGRIVSRIVHIVRVANLIIARNESSAVSVKWKINCC